MTQPALRQAGKALLPAEFKPVLQIDHQTQLALSTLAKRFLGKANNRLLITKVQAILAGKFPGRDIEVSDATLPHDQATKTISLIVSVDGKPDQGLVFGFRKPDGSIYGTAVNDSAVV